MRALREGAVVMNSFLIDGPLMSTFDRRKAMIERMAKDLVKFDAAQNEADAIRSLMARGYSPFAVLRYVDDARQVAFQSIVAREMAKS
jgi:hypothetical protein